MWNRTNRLPRAPLKIRTPSRANYYVKLVDANTGADAVGIFVRGGQTVEAIVPLGSYRLRYATGQTWRGEAALFGPDTIYNEALSRLDFADQGSGYIVELIRQEGGNLETHRISPSQF